MKRSHVISRSASRLPAQSDFPNSLLGWTLVCLLAYLLQAAPVAAQTITFEQHVRPILKQQCFHCHGEEQELPGGLDVRLVRLMKDGGDSGTAIVPGDAEASLLWERVESDEMPEGPKKLTDDQKQTIYRWIQQGATTLRPEPENVEDARFSHEELSHWAFQPVTKPAIPDIAADTDFTIHAPIDAFVAQELQTHGLRFSPDVDRRTFLRRASFDVIGLPPSPEESQAFLEDNTAGAWERLVDRLLASPQFGVRWARHWLDVAGYAETDGGNNGGGLREYAWRYRDYVIDCLNQNHPIDAFLREQLAGDELGLLTTDEAERQRLLTATGFLRMAPDLTQSSNTRTDRNTAVAETMKVVSTAMLGVTVGCAQCHDHKYDPIGIDDYYRFRAIFDPAFPLDQWKPPNSRLVDFTTAKVRSEAERIEKQCKDLEADIQKRKLAYAQEIFAAKLADVPDKLRADVEAAILAEPASRTEAQKELLELYPMVKTVKFIAGFLVEYDNAAYRRFQSEEEKIQKLRATKPAPHKIMVTQEQPGVIPESRVLFRGNPDSPTDIVEPAELFVLARHVQVDIPKNSSDFASTGRRLAYAQHLTNGHHPLTARVFVNRVWQHYFGRGLVETVNDFGISGERPSHPQLLDWLANDFVESGWDFKRLHRTILLSKIYRQSSRRRPEHEAIDPENRLLARMNLRRLDAESLRDAMLHAAGRLANSVSGPSTPVTEDQEGKIVIGNRKERDGLQVGVDSDGLAEQFRSIFVQVKRKQALYMLEAFDQPAMNPNCDVRAATTVAPQALFFLNDSQAIELAEQFARRVVRAVTDDDLRIAIAFEIACNASPTGEQRRSSRQLIDTLSHQWKDEPDVSHRAYSVLCQTLLSSNAFLYLD